MLGGTIAENSIFSFFNSKTIESPPCLKKEAKEKPCHILFLIFAQEVYYFYIGIIPQFILFLQLLKYKLCFKSS